MERSEQMEKLMVYEQFLNTFIRRKTPLKLIAGHQCVPECFTFEYPGKPEYLGCSVTGAIHHCDAKSCWRSVSTSSGRFCQTTGRKIEQKFGPDSSTEKEREQPRADVDSVLTKRAALESAQKAAALREEAWQLQKVQDNLVIAKSARPDVAACDRHDDADQTKALVELVVQTATQTNSVLQNTAADELRTAISEAKIKAAAISAEAATQVASMPPKKRKRDTGSKSRPSRNSKKDFSSNDLRARAREVLESLVKEKPVPEELRHTLDRACERCEYMWKIVSSVSAPPVNAGKLKFEYVCVVVTLSLMRDGYTSDVFTCDSDPMVSRYLPALADISHYKHKEKPFVSDQRTAHARVIREILKLLDLKKIPWPDFVRYEKSRQANPTPSARAVEHSTWLEFQPKPIEPLKTPAYKSTFMNNLSTTARSKK
jgi:hypothetical protein